MDNDFIISFFFHGDLVLGCSFPQSAQLSTPFVLSEGTERLQR